VTAAAVTDVRQAYVNHAQLAAHIVISRIAAPRVADSRWWQFGWQQ
jgi:hypothetical protein